MSRTIICTAAALVAVPLLLSCEKKEGDRVQPAQSYWGKQRVYKDFLWKKYKPDTLYQTLAFDFNEDARLFMGGPLVMALFDKDNGGGYRRLSTDVATVVMDGKVCPDNLLEICPNCEHARVGVVFNPDAGEKTYHWHFLPIKGGGLDRINDVEIEKENEPLMEVKAAKQNVVNPLALGLESFLVTALAILVLSIHFLRMQNPPFKVNMITLEGPGQHMKSINLRGYRTLVLTSRSQRQGFVNQIFTGKIRYDIDGVWTADVVIKPGDGKSLEIRTAPGGRYLCKPSRLVLGRTQVAELMDMHTRGTVKIRII